MLVRVLVHNYHLYEVHTFCILIYYEICNVSPILLCFMFIIIVTWLLNFILFVLAFKSHGLYGFLYCLILFGSIIGEPRDCDLVRILQGCCQHFVTFYLLFIMYMYFIFFSICSLPLCLWLFSALWNNKWNEMKWNDCLPPCTFRNAMLDHFTVSFTVPFHHFWFKCYFQEYNCYISFFMILLYETLK